MKTVQFQQEAHTTKVLRALEYIPDCANQFFQAKKAEGVSAYTLTFYRQQLGHFLSFCEGQVIYQMSEITPATIREFLLWHEDTGHNAGGLHAAYRSLKAFLRWYEQEAEPDNWKNPISKVKAPRVSLEPLEPVEIQDVSSLVKVCRSGGFMDLRDKAVLLFLLDTGVRAREALRVNLDDISLISGEVTIRQGKGRKPRTVFLGKTTRKAVRAYLKSRIDSSNALWVTDDQERLSYGGLRGIMMRRAKQVGIEIPSLHSFRRAFAINMLRAGVDLVTLARLMGHSSLVVLQRYLKQLPDDLRVAHAKGSPVDLGGF